MEKLNKQSSVKYLGVLVDNDLTWKTHVNYLRRSCMEGRTPSSLSRTKTNVPKFRIWTTALSCGTHVGDVEQREYRTMHSGSSSRSHHAQNLEKQRDGQLLRHNAMLCKVHRCLKRQGPCFLTCKFHTNSNLNYVEGPAKSTYTDSFYRSTF